MDPTLSLIMANMAQCQTGQIAFDPFCGTGKNVLEHITLMHSYEFRRNSSGLC